MTGIEPVSLAWKAKVLPLHNTRDIKYLALILLAIWHEFGTVLIKRLLDQEVVKRKVPRYSV